MQEQIYRDTSGKLARDAATATQTIIKYANLGLLDCIRSSDGRRLFAAGQAEKVKAILNERTRGRRPQVAA